MPEQVILQPGAQMMQAPPSDDFNRFTQEMQILISEMEAFLTGFRTVPGPNNTKKQIKIGDALVNDEGKNAILNWLRSYLNPNTYMSLTKSGDTYNNYCNDADDLIDDLCVNHSRYGLYIDDFPPITAKITAMMFFALRKAETDKEYIFRNMRSNYTPTGEIQKKGLLGGLF